MCNWATVTHKEIEEMARHASLREVELVLHSWKMD